MNFKKGETVIYEGEAATFWAVLLEGSLDVHLGDDDTRNNIQNFMPFSFLAVNKMSEAYETQERRFNYTTPKSFLELITLYKKLLVEKTEINVKMKVRLEEGLVKLRSSAAQVADMQVQLKDEAVVVELRVLAALHPLDGLAVGALELLGLLLARAAEVHLLLLVAVPVEVRDRPSENCAIIAP